MKAIYMAAIMKTFSHAPDTNTEQNPFASMSSVETHLLSTIPATINIVHLSPSIWWQLLTWFGLSVSCLLPSILSSQYTGMILSKCDAVKTIDSSFCSCRISFILISLRGIGIDLLSQLSLDFWMFNKVALLRVAFLKIQGEECLGSSAG